MNRWRRCIIRARAYLWVPVAVLLAQLWFPLSFHKHHDGDHDRPGLEHAIDFHLPTDRLASDHLDDSNGQELKLSPQLMTKQDFDAGFISFLAISFLALLFTNAAFDKESYPSDQRLFRRLAYYRLAPPLRAPPAV